MRVETVFRQNPISFWNRLILACGTLVVSTTLSASCRPSISLTARTVPEPPHPIWWMTV
jgi:hypothetical protein